MIIVPLLLSSMTVYFLILCRNLKSTKSWASQDQRMWQKWESLTTTMSAGKLFKDTAASGRYVAILLY